MIVQSVATTSEFSAELDVTRQPPVQVLGLQMLLHPESILLLASVRGPASTKGFELERTYAVLTTVDSWTQMKLTLSNTMKLET